KEREAVASFPVSSMLVFRATTPAQRTAILKAANGSTNTKTLRSIKAKVVGKKQRRRTSSAEATQKLAQLIGPKVVRAILNGHDPWSLAAGARFAQDTPGEVASAILFLANNDPKVKTARAKATA